jgi:hypothetical protein
MHLALARRKFSFAQLAPGAGRENLVTSTILGTLKYLPPQDVARFLVGAFIDHAPTQTARQTLDSLERVALSGELSMDTEFWPNYAKSGRIEPDAVFTFRGKREEAGKRQIALLIECKWDAKQSGDRQLWKQWMALPARERDQWLHVYLVKNMSEGVEDIDSAPTLNQEHQRLWRDRLCVATWRSFARGPAPGMGTAMRAWCADIRDALEQLEVFAFEGFRNVGGARIEDRRGLTFWHGFKGFKEIGLEEQPWTRAQPLFWRGRKFLEQVGEDECQLPRALFWAAAGSSEAKRVAT